jgi:hypothetical protein
LSCSKEKADCLRGSWIDNIWPQLKDNFGVYGQPALQVDLHPDQVIYFFYIPL